MKAGEELQEEEEEEKIAKEVICFVCKKQIQLRKGGKFISQLGCCGKIFHHDCLLLHQSLGHKDCPFCEKQMVSNVRQLIPKATEYQKANDSYGFIPSDPAASRRRQRYFPSYFSCTSTTSVIETSRRQREPNHSAAITIAGSSSTTNGTNRLTISPAEPVNRTLEQLDEEVESLMIYASAIRLSLQSRQS